MPIDAKYLLWLLIFSLFNNQSEASWQVFKNNKLLNCIEKSKANYKKKFITRLWVLWWVWNNFKTDIKNNLREICIYQLFYVTTETSVLNALISNIYFKIKEFNFLKKISSYHSLQSTELVSGDINVTDRCSYYIVLKQSSH